MNASSVVQATIENLEDVALLFDAYRVWYGEKTDLDGARAFLFDRFEHSESVTFLAFSEAGTAVGFAQLYPLFSSVSMKRLWLLNDLYVAEQARGQGWGRRLLQASKDHAAATRSKGVFLETQKTNTRAQALYEDFGFLREQEFLAYHLNLGQPGKKGVSLKKTYRKIALAYSGGLDTSIIIPWLKENYGGAEIVGVSVDVGQKEDWDAVRRKGEASGASKLFIVDAKEEFARDYLFPLLRAGAIYEGKYLLGTSIARPLTAMHQVRVALEENCDAVAHGCTGKGNDQVRFELTYKALAPQLGIIAPWREWDITSREEAIEYAQKHNIPLGTITKENIYSRDWNIWHMSHEGGDLEDPWNRPQEKMFQLSKSLRDSPDQETEVTIEFEQGIPVALDGKKLNGLALLDQLNRVGGENGVGRADVVETRTVGMKSRGVYETPAGTILFTALRELEMLCLDSETLDAKKTLAQDYARLVYTGKWFTAFRVNLDAFFESSSRYLTGTVKVVLYKGNVLISGRKSPYSLYQQDLASFGKSSYDHHDATGFLKLFGLSTGVQAAVQPSWHKK